MGIVRKFFRVLTWPTVEDIKNGDYSGAVAIEAKNELEANLIGSRTRTYNSEGQQMHAPVLDIDFPARLIPSSTPDHYHLYLDKEMTWENYTRLLKVMAEVGIIEQKYYEHALKQGQTQVRKPGVSKFKLEPEPAHAIRFKELRDAMNQILYDAGIEKKPEPTQMELPF